MYKITLLRLAMYPGPHILAFQRSNSIPQELQSLWETQTEFCLCVGPSMSPQACDTGLQFPSFFTHSFYFAFLTCNLRKQICEVQSQFQHQLFSATGHSPLFRFSLWAWAGFAQPPLTGLNRGAFSSEEMGFTLSIVSGSAEHDKNLYRLFCPFGIFFSLLSGTQCTRILDEARFIEISGTSIAELCLIQLHIPKPSVLQGYTSGFTAFQ